MTSVAQIEIRIYGVGNRMSVATSQHGTLDNVLETAKLMLEGTDWNNARITFSRCKEDHGTEGRGPQNP